MTISMLIMGITSILAQGAYQEYLHCQTDKDLYLAGERLWFRLWSVDENGAPQQRSRIAYVELVGADANDAHCVVELSAAGGSGVIDLPFTLPSGSYQLRAYTRNMLNLDSKAICRKTIGVFNALRHDEDKDKVAITRTADSAAVPTGGSISVSTDKSSYGTRQAVNITLGGLPAMTRVAVSVARQDGIRPSAEAQYTPVELTDLGIEPEDESQILTGRYVSESGKAASHPNISIRSRGAIHYYAGEMKGDKALFRTPLIRGVEKIYAGVDAGGRIVLDTAFVSPRLTELPAVTISAADEALLQERSVGLQAARYFGADSLRGTRKALEVPHLFKMTRHYDMDEYKRFDTFAETFVEYATECGTTTKDGERKITLFDDITSKPNNGNTLVMIDGIAVMNHEDLLGYSPRRCKYIDIYLGYYIFGNQIYSGILNIRTPDGKASHFPFPANSAGTTMLGALLSTRQPLVCGDKTLTPLPENMPDGRHTIYWNPDTQETQLTCLTSDLKGTYVVSVEGISPEGVKVKGTTTFTVE